MVPTVIDRIQSVARLQAYGLEQELAERTVKVAIVFAPGLSCPFETFIQTLGQAAARSFVKTNELLSLIHYGIPLATILNERFGTTICVELEQRGVTSRQVIEAMVEDLERRAAVRRGT